MEDFLFLDIFFLSDSFSKSDYLSKQEENINIFNLKAEGCLISFMLILTTFDDITSSSFQLIISEKENIEIESPQSSQN